MSGADGDASDVVVSVVETATAVGLTAARTAAAVRAGIAGFAELAEYSPVPAEIVDEDDDDEPAPLIAATHGLAHGDGAERLIDLTVEPLAAAIGAARISRSELARAGFYVALPYADPTIAGLSLERTFFPTLRERLGLPAVLDPIGTQS